MGDRTEGYGPSTYGDRIADAYDDMYHHAPGFGDVAHPVAFLASLAGDGPALELGIGTGRIALPLQAAGRRVHGIDASAEMVERMRAKPGGERRPGHDRRLQRLHPGRAVPAHLRPVQHDLRVAHPGRSGDVLPSRGSPPRPGRRVRDRGVRAGPGQVRPGATRLGGPRRSGLGLARRVGERSRRAVRQLAARRDPRREGQALSGADPLRVRRRSST